MSRRTLIHALVPALVLAGLRAPLLGAAHVPDPGSRAVAPVRHITPTVYLYSKKDAIRLELPEATRFFLKEVEIGQKDFELVKSRTGWSPEDRKFAFYSGKDAASMLLGTIEFVLVDTQHGPIEVALAFDPQDRVSQVLVITATVETVPWVKAVVKSGMLEGYVGVAADAKPDALGRASADALGQMPYWAAQVIDRGVVRGLALYDALYRTSSTSA